MRVWDLNPRYLCRQHLLGEHRELHAIWTILTTGKRGYARHPETLRWRGKLKALYLRHELLVLEMRRRNYQHNSLLDKKKARGQKTQRQLIDSLARQKIILRNKPCPCFRNYA